MFCSLLTFSLNVVLEWLLGALCGNIRRFYEDSVVLKDSSLVSVIVLICLSLSFNLIVITSYFRTLALNTPNNVWNLPFQTFNTPPSVWNIPFQTFNTPHYFGTGCPTGFAPPFTDLRSRPVM